MMAWLRHLLRRMWHRLDTMPLVGSYTAVLPPQGEDQAPKEGTA